MAKRFKSALSGVAALLLAVATAGAARAQEGGGSRSHNPYSAQRADTFVFYGRQDRLRAAQQFAATLRAQTQTIRALNLSRAREGSEVIAMAQPPAIMPVQPDTLAFPVPTVRMMLNADYRRAAERTQAAEDAQRAASARVEVALVALASAENRLSDIMRGYSGRDLADIEVDLAGLPAGDDPARGILEAERTAARLFEARRLEGRAKAARAADEAIAASRAEADAREDLATARQAEGMALMTAWNGQPPEGPDLDAFRRRLGISGPADLAGRTETD